ncbi:MAG: glycosyltransferase family 25 protein [Verrucomicrobiota bacterium]|jgi:GR25 family glycosyltransferase involved in LPS biosynthesis
MMDYAGYFINLDRDVDRRQAVEAQVAALNLRHLYKRHPAALGNVLNIHAPNLSQGAVGCFTSHYQLLKSLIKSPAHIHVVEDDVLFSSSMRRVIESVIQAGILDKWDLLFTDIWIPVDLDHIQELSARLSRSATLDSDGRVLSVNQFNLIDLKGRTFAATASYLVNRSSIPKIVEQLAGAIAAELNLPIDLFYRQEIDRGQLKAACLFPFITSVSVEQSLFTNISDRNDTSLLRSTLASTLLRNLFFIQCDPQKLRQLAEDHLGPPATDDRAKVLAAVSHFASTPDFKKY